ncbi:MAG: metal-sensing transcriptional repressor [Chloroflexota bacterium]
MPEDLTRQIFNRLRYIEGQAQGVRRMLIGGRPPDEVVAQMRALEAAAAGARELYLRQLAQAQVYEEVRLHLADLLPSDDATSLLTRLEERVFTPPAKRRRRTKKAGDGESPAEPEEEPLA